MLEVRPFSRRDRRFQEILVRTGVPDEASEGEAAEALRAVRERGVDALLDKAQPEGGTPLSEEQLLVGEEEMTRARNEVSEQFLTALSLARVNIRKFHEYQRRLGYLHDDGDGVRLSWRIRPLARVGICCGESFSALLMCAVPAQVAGVGTLVAAVAARADGTVEPHYLAAARMLGIDAVYRVGGAHAVAALAEGVSPFPKVDKIVGPGGAAAEAAKRLVSARVGVDHSSSSPDLAIIADEGANARFIAADFLAQVEHDDGRGATVLFSSDRLLAEAVRIELERMAEELPNPTRLRQALDRGVSLFICRSLPDAISAVNAMAPSRVSLLTQDNEEVLPDIENAGAIFVGPWSGDVMGDPLAGVSQILPGPGRAGHATSLRVEDFVKETPVLEYSPQRLVKTGRHTAIMAEAEASPARAAAVRERTEVLKLSI